MIGFDALPEALAAVRDGALAGTSSSSRASRAARRCRSLVDFLRDGKKPESELVLLTPIAITKDNLDKAERLGELK